MSGPISTSRCSREVCTAFTKTHRSRHGDAEIMLNLCHKMERQEWVDTPPLHLTFCARRFRGSPSRHFYRYCHHRRPCWRGVNIETHAPDIANQTGSSLTLHSYVTADIVAAAAAAAFGVGKIMHLRATTKGVYSAHTRVHASTPPPPYTHLSSSIRPASSSTGTQISRRSFRKPDAILNDVSSLSPMPQRPWRGRPRDVWPAKLRASTTGAPTAVRHRSVQTRPRSFAIHVKQRKLQQSTIAPSSVKT